MLNPLEVKLEAFEGPLDLLLHLIRENKVDIYDIPIATITEQYLEYLKIMKEMDLEVAGEFLVMAATLVYIKSKMLLPLDESDDDQDEGLDPRDELVKKLLEYQSFKEAAKELGLLAQERKKVFTRQITDHYLRDINIENTGEMFQASLFDLIQAFSRIVQEQSKQKRVHKVYEEVISIEEKVAYIRELFMERETISFAELLRAQPTRNELIASFLAILELTKQKAIVMLQQELFGEIILKKYLNRSGEDTNDSNG